ncbi:MAG: hypothetical protein P4L46_09735 [Fimbriimonas sp.]|nr:hypothetical protein [Fimbriimonas sp.]
MQKTYLFLLIAAIGGAALCGCGSGPDQATTTPQDKKSFQGGEMPPDVRKKFEESMAQNGKRTQEIADKARANAVAGH